MVRKYNKTYHRTIEMKPADVKPDMCILYGMYHNDKSIFTNGYTLTWSRKCELGRKKILCHGHMLLSISAMKRCLENFMKNL